MVEQQTSIASSPTISLDDQARQSIVTVMFSLDINIINWIGSTYYDAHTMKQENGSILLVPNAEFYECPKCKQVKSSNTDIAKLYSECSGTKQKSHDTIPTKPLNWKPLFSKSGINYILGSIYAMINANIQTGNFGKNELDVKKKAELDERLMWTAFDSSVYSWASILDDRKTNVALWIVGEDGNDKKVIEVFNVGFLARELVNMTINIYSSLTKGKGMEAVSKLMESRSHIEQEIINRTQREETVEDIKKRTHGGIFGNIGNVLKSTFDK